MRENNCRQQLSTFLKTVKGERINIAAGVYDIISSSENADIGLRCFLENAEDIESSETKEAPEIFTPQMQQKLRAQYEQLTTGILDKLVGERLCEEEFYKKLWEAIEDNELIFSKKEEKIYALYQIWSDPRIPYFYLKTGLKMDNEEFKEICLNDKIKIKKLNYILNADYEQKTERSSLILEELKECQDESEKVVLMAQVLSGAENKGRLEVIKSLRKK